MFFSLQVDRGNLTQAVSDNMLDDLNMTTNGESTLCRYAVADELLTGYRLQLRQRRVPCFLSPGRASFSTGV